MKKYILLLTIFLFSCSEQKYENNLYLNKSIILINKKKTITYRSDIIFYLDFFDGYEVQKTLTYYNFDTLKINDSLTNVSIKPFNLLDEKELNVVNFLFVIEKINKDSIRCFDGKEIIFLKTNQEDYNQISKNDTLKNFIIISKGYRFY
jgi:hypothetical protein